MVDSSLLLSTSVLVEEGTYGNNENTSPLKNPTSRDVIADPLIFPLLTFFSRFFRERGMTVGEMSRPRILMFGFGDGVVVVVGGHANECTSIGIHPDPEHISRTFNLLSRFSD